MAIKKPRRVTVTTSATRLDSTGVPFDGGAFAVGNLGSATVYFGQSDVTTANGFPILAGASLAVDSSNLGAVYGIVASGTVEVAILEVGN